MRKHAPAVIAVVALAVSVVAGLREPASADAQRFRAFVYPDRAQPERVVVVTDFRVNETVWDEGGVQYLWVRGPAGNFKLALQDIRQVEVVKFLGLTKMDWARYDVKVTGTNEAVYLGAVEIRVFRGIVDGHEWYYYPATQKDRGTGFWRVVVADTEVPPTIPPEVGKAEERPVPVATPVPASPPPPPPAEDALFERLSLDELNARQPLGDAFFDFDSDTLRPDAEAVLQRNAAWMARWPSTVVRVEGYADPRGTQEYNVELGQRRASVARDYLMGLGVAADRVSIVSRGPSQAFCAEQTEECWARNRRAHFVITAK